MSDEKTLVGAVKTEQGVEVKGMLMQPVVEKCEGCDRVRTFEEQQFCGSFPNPAQKGRKIRSVVRSSSTCASAPARPPRSTR